MSEANECGNQIVVYQLDEIVRLEVRLENETVWLSQRQMCDLFGRERSVITKHINNVFSDGELVEANNVQIVHNNHRGKPLALYSLDVSLSVKESAAFHDRFLILDGKKLYLIGASLKDPCKRCFGFTKMDSREIPGLMARV